MTTLTTTTAKPNGDQSVFPSSADRGSKTPRTILLIHGLWVTPLSWEKFQRRYESLGHRVIASPWPGIDGEVASIRSIGAPGLKGIGIQEVIDHYSGIIRSLREPPIIVGHSYGGLITQLLIDRGLGCAGVAIDSVPPKGILILPLSTYGALTPAFLKPGTYWGTFMFTFKQWWRVFANTLSKEEAMSAYEQQVIPASGRAIFQAALANMTPNALSTINFRNAERAPLLFIGGEKDVIMPAALNRKNFRKYSGSAAVTEYKEFPGRSHYIIAEQGWEEVADYALHWADTQAQTPKSPA